MHVEGHQLVLELDMSHQQRKSVRKIQLKIVEICISLGSTLGLAPSTFVNSFEKHFRVFEVFSQI